MLTFADLFPGVVSEPKRYKVHLAIGWKIKREPLIALSKGKFKEWQEYQNHENFGREFIISLVYCGTSRWVFAGIYRSLGAERKYNSERNKHYFHYTTELVDIHADLIGKLVFAFEKDFRQSYVLLEKHVHRFEVYQIQPDRTPLNPFPGYGNVILKFEELQEIVAGEHPEWRTALSNAKGVYLITDTRKGRHYVGAAYGGEAFWSRWQSYSEDGHGSNVELRKLIHRNGIGYAKNLQFSILEIRTQNADDDEICAREKHWKDVLLTRQFGYNGN